MSKIMNLRCDAEVGIHLRSPSQRVRVVTEGWFASEAYCIACPSTRLIPTKPNSIANDFVCSCCGQSYELKSSKDAASKRVVDGSYRTMVERIRGPNVPALMLLQYSSTAAGLEWTVNRLVAIHPVFLTEAVVEARRPLAETAQRAGWQGCTLRIDRIPAEGKIDLIRDGNAMEPSEVKRLYDASRLFSAIDQKERGWTALVLSVVREIRSKNFDLAAMYAQKQVFEEAFPNNRNVEAKVRQQLQILRDFGYLRFSGRGRYEVIR